MSKGSWNERNEGMEQEPRPNRPQQAQLLVLCSQTHRICVTASCLTVMV